MNNTIYNNSMQFTELNDKQWNIIKQHIPKPSKTERPRSNDRMVLNGIIYVLISGCRWDEMPRKYGDDSTVNLRLRKWQGFGVWKKILRCTIASAHKQNKINLQKISVDSSSIPAKKRVLMMGVGFNGFKRITGTKIHVAVEQNGLPVSIVISSVNIHDSTKFVDVIESISEYLDDDSIEEIVSVYADKGYDTKDIRTYPEKQRNSMLYSIQNKF